MKASGPGGAVVAASHVWAIFNGFDAGLISLGCGLVAVALSRWVFINREMRRVRRRESWHETLPLTLVAMLIAGVIIHDRHLSLSASVFVGLGAGWTAVVLLDILGQRTMDGLRALLGSGPVNPLPPHADLSGREGQLDSDVVDVPRDMARLIDRADEEE